MSAQLKTLSGPVKKRAMDTIRAVAHAVQIEGKSALSYSDLGRVVGVMAVPGVGHKSYLEAATIICRTHGLPDIAVSVVTQESLLKGSPMPSDDVFDETGYWVSSGLYRHEIAAEQARVFAYDWLGDKRLWPKLIQRNL